MQLVVDGSAVLCAAAVAAVAMRLAVGRERRAIPWALIAAFGLLAIWFVVASVYLRGPYSALRARALLAALCAAQLPWLVAAVGIRRPGGGAVSAGWLAFFAAQGVACAVAASAMWFAGVDWITGIGSEPVVVLSGWGMMAGGLSVALSFAALVTFAVRLFRQMNVARAQLLGPLVAVGSVTWLWAGLLSSGYLSTGRLSTAVALASAAAVVWGVGVVREMPLSPLLPSRRLVYGAMGAGFVVAYLLTARAALGWIAALGYAVIPNLIPALAFTAVAVLLVAGGSPRLRHRLWVGVGRHLFAGKHDHGELWIRLTELISAARDGADLARRTAGFCRQVLCTPEVSVWTTDGAGRLQRTAVAHAPALEADAAPVVGAGGGNGRGQGAVSDYGEKALAEATGSCFACPMRADGRLLGVVAVGSGETPVDLDEEDREVVRRVSAQVASALGIHRLAEEAAEAREVNSFHRLSAFVVHDLKNLVAQQAFVLENAARFKGDPTFVGDALAAFKDSTDRMRSLINRLRPRAPLKESTNGNCDVVRLVRELAEMPHLRAAMDVRIIAPEGARECRVQIDRVSLARVLSNLLVNSVESLPAEGGEIKVAIERAAAGWRVAVNDNGRGIPPAFLDEHLFRPFQTTKDGGLGIGLYQCKSIVESVGGAIEVTSRENMGTTVAITLPAESQADGAAPARRRGNGKAHAANC